MLFDVRECGSARGVLKTRSPVAAVQALPAVQSCPAANHFGGDTKALAGTAAELVPVSFAQGTVAAAANAVSLRRRSVAHAAEPAVVAHDPRLGRLAVNGLGAGHADGDLDGEGVDVGVHAASLSANTRRIIASRASLPSSRALCGAGGAFGGLGAATRGSRGFDGWRARIGREPVAMKCCAAAVASARVA